MPVVVVAHGGAVELGGEDPQAAHEVVGLVPDGPARAGDGRSHWSGPIEATMRSVLRRARSRWSSIGSVTGVLSGRRASRTTPYVRRTTSSATSTGSWRGADGGGQVGEGVQRHQWHDRAGPDAERAVGEPEAERTPGLGQHQAGAVTEEHVRQVRGAEQRRAEDHGTPLAERSQQPEGEAPPHQLLGDAGEDAADDQHEQQVGADGPDAERQRAGRYDQRHHQEARWRHRPAG